MKTLIFLALLFLSSSYCEEKKTSKRGVFGEQVLNYNLGDLNNKHLSEIWNIDTLKSDNNAGQLTYTGPNSQNSYAINNGYGRNLAGRNNHLNAEEARNLYQNQALRQGYNYIQQEALKSEAQNSAKNIQNGGWDFAWNYGLLSGDNQEIAKAYYNFGRNQGQKLNKNILYDTTLGTIDGLRSFGQETSKQNIGALYDTNRGLQSNGYGQRYNNYNLPHGGLSQRLASDIEGKRNELFISNINNLKIKSNNGYVQAEANNGNQRNEGRQRQQYNNNYVLVNDNNEKLNRLNNGLLEGSIRSSNDAQTNALVRLASANPKKLIHLGSSVQQHVIVEKKVGIPIPQPYAVEVTKHIPIPVPRPIAVPVIKPYAVHIPRPIEVKVEKLVPVPVSRPLVIPVPVSLNDQINNQQNIQELNLRENTYQRQASQNEEYLRQGYNNQQNIEGTYARYTNTLAGNAKLGPNLFDNQQLNDGNQQQSYEQSSYESQNGGQGQTSTNVDYLGQLQEQNYAWST